MEKYIIGGIMSKVEIRGVLFDNVDMDQATGRVLQLLEEDGCHIVVTPNSEIAQMCIEDERLRKVINGADMSVPDGIGVLYASKILKRPLKQKVAGVDLAKSLLPVMAEKGISLFLFGAKQEVVESAEGKIKNDYPGINICGINNGYFDSDKEIIEKINNSGADIVFVCLGAPKQEFWMYENRGAINAKVMIGLGGSLDVFSGKAKRAPDIFIKLGLEWFYRLLKEPKRFFRMLKLPKYLFGTIIYKFKNGGGN